MKWTYASEFGLIILAALPLIAVAADSPASPGSAAPAASATVSTNLSQNVAEVVKLAQSGVGDDVVLAYIKNSRAPFSLSAGDILTLKNQGISTPVVTAMLTHDTALRSQSQTQGSGAAQNGAVAATRQVDPTPIAPQSVAPQTRSTIADAPTVAPAPSAASAPTVAADSQVASATAVAPSTPPPAQVEVVPVAPGPDYVWTSGYWAWRGGGWVWIGGVWTPPPPRPHIGIWIGPGPRPGPPPRHWRHW